ncbi:putative oxidoreductase YrbE [Tachypleus tridentatus]|uniref:putative oxidoreductase YrbE n=1 Tax=Tachypleus tridentatus TaxID=6853 RepID=UPI003FD401E8
MSGGLFHDCAIHDIDLICWILGELPTSVYAHSHAFNSLFKDIDDFDTAGIVMNFPSGVISLTDLSRSAVYGYDQRIEVFGSKGMLNSGNIRPTGVVSHCSNGSTAVPICYSFASRYNDAYSFEIEHFLDTVQDLGKTEVIFLFTRTMPIVDKIFFESKCGEMYLWFVHGELGLFNKVILAKEKTKVTTSDIVTELKFKTNLKEI